MQPYSALTTRGQARRMRVLAMDALGHDALDVKRLVTNDQKGISRVDAGDGQKTILRVNLPEGGRTRDQLKAKNMSGAFAASCARSSCSTTAWSAAGTWPKPGSRSYQYALP